MKTTDCDLPVEELVAYADGELAGRRREAVEAALRTSPACRRQVADVRAVRLLLRDGSPLIDDPVGRADTQARIAQEASRRARPWRVPSARYAMPLVLLVLLLAGLPASAGVGVDLHRTVRAATDGLKTVLSRGSGTADEGGTGATGGYRYGPGATVELPPTLQRMASLTPDPAQFAMSTWNPAQVIASQMQAERDESNQGPQVWTPPWQVPLNGDCQNHTSVGRPTPPPRMQYGQRCV
jgi:hypothetical protein